jgi:hypothetical protein
MQAFGDRQIGQYLGSMLSICYSVSAKTGVFNPKLSSFLPFAFSRQCVTDSFAAGAQLIEPRLL